MVHSKQNNFQKQVLFVIVLFWLLYYFMVTLTNFFDLLKGVTILDQSWQFASGNFQQVTEVISRYNMGHNIAVLLLICATILEFLLFLAFIRALIVFDKSGHHSAIGFALLASVAFWGLFIIVDEIFIAYLPESAHLRLLILALLSAFFYRNTHKPAQ